MPTSSAELQPHEFPASKTEALLHAVRSSATDKIDLVQQRVGRHGTSINGGESTFYLRFWRYAQGQVSIQEVPMHADELLGLSVYVLDRMKKALAAEDEAPVDEGDKSYTFKQGEGSWSQVENKDGKDAARKDKAHIRVVGDSDGGYTAFGFHKGISYTSQSSSSIAAALRDLADDIESNLNNKAEVDDVSEPHEDPVVEAVVAAQAEDAPDTSNE